VRFDGRTSHGKAHLEAADIVFRGGFSLRIPFAEIRCAEARRGTLEVAFAKGKAVFVLGARAEKWALKIRYPRGLLDKLGVKPGSRVSVLGLDDPDFRDQLATRTSDVSERARRESDLVFWATRSKGELRARLEALRRSMKPNGAIWVIWPKGQKALREDDVREVGPRVGLVDVKVVSFSDTLSAL
jgi:hypothetical protein